MKSSQLLIEFALLFLIAPLFVAALLPAKWMFPILWIWTAIGIGLLATTKEFQWRKLWRNIPKHSWGFALVFSTLALGVALTITWLTFPERLLILPRQEIRIWIIIIIFYPILSALPQELIFRVLFFERYGKIIPKQSTSFINATIFSYAHLLYWNAIVFTLTFIGGYILAHTYKSGNFPMAVILHSLGGIMIFTSGLGALFYSGNIG